MWRGRRTTTPACRSRSSSGPRWIRPRLLPSVRETLKRIDASLPLRKGQPLEVFVSESTAPERFRTMVLGMLALLGLVLAAVGISGVTYRGVIDRTRDFAVRLALGSAPGGVVRLVLGETAPRCGTRRGRRPRRRSDLVGARSRVGSTTSRQWTRRRPRSRSGSSRLWVWPPHSCRPCASCASIRRECYAARRGACGRFDAPPGPARSAGG